MLQPSYAETHISMKIWMKQKTIIEMVKKYEPDLFIAGPAFNAGRYGVACGTIAKAIGQTQHSGFNGNVC